MHFHILGDSFLGSVSQFNIWSSSDMLPQDPTCRSQKSGDKLSWSKFVFANLTETAVSLPSECDGKTCKHRLMYQHVVTNYGLTC